MTIMLPAAMVKRIDGERKALSVTEGRVISRREMLARLLSYALDFRSQSIEDGYGDPIAAKLGYEK